MTRKSQLSVGLLRSRDLNAGCCIKPGRADGPLRALVRNALEAVVRPRSAQSTRPNGGKGRHEPNSVACWAGFRRSPTCLELRVSLPKETYLSTDSGKQRNHYSQLPCGTTEPSYHYRPSRKGLRGQDGRAGRCDDRPYVRIADRHLLPFPPLPFSMRHLPFPPSISRSPKSAMSKTRNPCPSTKERNSHIWSGPLQEHTVTES